MIKNLTILFLCLSTAASAQQVRFGAKGGLNIATMTNIDDSKVRASIHLGAFAKIGLTEEWAVQPELVYSAQGYKWDLPVPIIDNPTLRYNVNYINLPVMVQYHIIPEFHLEAGPQVGFRIAAKVKNEDGDATNIKDDVKGLDFGLGAGLGYTFDMGLGIGARYNFGLTDIWKTEQFSGKNSVAQFSVYYTIGKKKF